MLKTLRSWWGRDNATIPVCTECKHYEHRPDESYQHRCRVHVEIRQNMVTGETQEFGKQFCDIERDHGSCGKRGRYFEPRNERGEGK